MSRADRARAASKAGNSPGPRSSAPSKAPATKRGQRTREKLVASAREIFGETAFSDVRITDITAAAGVASGTFYTYFDSKEEIFREIAAQVLREMSEAFRGGGEVSPSMAERVRANTRSYFACVRANRRIARSIEELQSREPGVGDARHRTLGIGVQRIERWIRRLQDRGICPPEVDPWPTALALHAMNVSVAYDHLVHRDAPEETEQLLDATTRVWCATLGLED